jgi:hypothetical protein
MDGINFIDLTGNALLKLENPALYIAWMAENEPRWQLPSNADLHPSKADA